MTTLTRYPSVTATAGAGPKLELLSNLVNNPRAGMNLAGFGYAAGTGGAAASSSVASGGPLSEAPSFFRVLWSAAQTANTSGAQVRNGAVGLNLIAAGRAHVFRAYIRASFAAVVQQSIGWYNDASFISAPVGPSVPLQSNVWTPLTFEGTAPANATRAQLVVNPTAASPLIPAGATFDSVWMLHEKPAGAPATALYGDGDLAGWEWLGTRHASPSRGYGAIT